MRLFVLMIVFLVGFSSLTKANKTKSNHSFVATGEWQEIPEGEGIPRGLHVRINLETGKKEAKLLDPEDSKENNQTSAVNSLTVVSDEVELPGSDEDKPESNSPNEISKEMEDEMKRLMKGLPLAVDFSPEKVENIKKKYKSYDELKKTYAEMKDHFKTDAEIITKLVQEYLNSTKVDQKSSNQETKTSGQLQILHHLGNLVHQYDNALWFIDSNGLENILLPLIVNETNVFLRVEAMRVLGALTQNNPQAQVKVFEANFGSHLSQILLTSTNSEELSSALFAFAALLRKFPYAQKKIFSSSGPQALVAVLTKECNLKVKAKAVTLISDVLNEQKLELSNLKDNDGLNLELQYRELHFDLWLQPHLFCEAMDTLITSNFVSFIEQPDLLEYFLQALLNTKEMCYYIWPQSPQLRHSLLTIKNNFERSGNEYELELVNDLKFLIKSLYLHDEL